MRPSITQDLKQTFHLHALRHEAKHLLTERQWDQYQQLTNRCERARDQEQKLFNERFHGRVDQECRKILKDNAAKTRDFKPVGQQDDLFDRASLLKQADRNVRNRHEQRLAKITRTEERGIETLLQRSSRQNQLTGQSKDAFTRAAERRSGNERRVRQKSEEPQKSTRRQTR